MNSNLSDNSDVIAGSSRPAPSHGTIQCFHSLNETKVFQTGFTSEEGVTVNVYDACANGSCRCSHVIGGEHTQLKPCRFVYLYSLATQGGKDQFSPLISSILDGFKVMDGSQESTNMSYDCKNYKFIFEENNKQKVR